MFLGWQGSVTKNIPFCFSTSEILWPSQPGSGQGKSYYFKVALWSALKPPEAEFMRPPAVA